MDKPIKKDNLVKEVDNFLDMGEESLGFFYADRFLLADDFEIEGLTDDDLSCIRHSTVQE